MMKELVVRGIELKAKSYARAQLIILDAEELIIANIIEENATGADSLDDMRAKIDAKYKSGEVDEKTFREYLADVVRMQNWKNGFANR